MRRLYGDGVRHLVAVLGCLAVAGYAASRAAQDRPAVVRLVVWFVGAAVVWDLVLGPLLSLGDRGLRRVLRTPRGGVVPLNYVRAPLLVSGVLLVVSAPLVLRRSDVYAGKTGLDLDVYLGRWLAVTAVLVAGSAVLFAVAALRRRHPSG